VISPRSVRFGNCNSLQNDQIPPNPPFSKGGLDASPFEKGGSRGICCTRKQYFYRMQFLNRTMLDFTGKMSENKRALDAAHSYYLQPSTINISMLPIITFIGWHNSGKTTLVTRVVNHLKQRGYRVAVIKSTKDQGISFDAAGTDTARHRQAGADTVLLVAPDQMTMITDNKGQSLADLAQRFCSDVDLVIGEGFKGAEGVAKIEVRRESGQPLLWQQVQGVIAVASDLVIAEAPDCALFRLDQGQEIADFIERYLGLNPVQSS